ncbi:hypothetical protein PTTG_05740 [Puccinia triticina 1-1 BBBD Race 1]|uniref:Uncharacterized protein n=1 Tax=Puccinia triticina (isolate 1-1 / race 1 (BBBD)) TaxID=630390 RepID=A0A0C4EY41_PUCT1|nr:hypothetical protein PTTG_05740 [Puccinia triticina 1-1 BBBD Race 1]
MPSSTQSNPPSSPTPKRNTKKPRACAINNNAEEPSKPSKKTKIAPQKTKAATNAELQDDDDRNDADDVAEALEKTTTTSAPKKTKNSKKKSVELEEDNDASEDSEKIPTIRLPNFTEDKHVQICCSWLETTKDPLNSTNQTGKTSGLEFVSTT